MRRMVLIDTDILIDVGRNVSAAVHCLQEIEQQGIAAISIISQMELVVGCRNKKELRVLADFLQRFRVIKLDGAISDVAVDLLSRYRLSHGLLIADALIAATSLAWNLPLISKNQRDYRFIENLNLLAYP